MRCPSCLSTDLKVTDSRNHIEDSSIHRRRLCLSCGHKFRTTERIENKALLVIKRDGRRESFDREKLRHGLIRALEKRDVSAESLAQAIFHIEQQAISLASSSGEINSDDLGGLTLTELKSLDPVAYVRFASVYKMFQDPNEFIEEIKELTHS